MKPFQLTARADLALAVVMARSVIRTGPRFAVGATDGGRMINLYGVGLRDLPFAISKASAKELPESANAIARAKQLAAFATVDPEYMVAVTLEGSEEDLSDSIFDLEFFRGVLAAMDYPGWRAALAAGNEVWYNSEQTDDDNDRADEARDEILRQLGTDATRAWVASLQEAAAPSPRERRSVADQIFRLASDYD